MVTSRRLEEDPEGFRCVCVCDAFLARLVLTCVLLFELLLLCVYVVRVI